MEKLFGTMFDNCRQDRNALVDKYELVREELLRFSKQQFEINSDPLLWWKDNSPCYQQLSKFARQRLTITATSVPAERVFSKAGQLVNAKRACLSSKNIDQIIFLNKNMQ